MFAGLGAPLPGLPGCLKPPASADVDKRNDIVSSSMSVAGMAKLHMAFIGHKTTGFCTLDGELLPALNQ